MFVLSGLQALLPDYLQERFVQAALSYIACNSEGEFICKDNDCWCQCGPRFPECNCPSMDIQAMEENLLRITETWKAYNSDFEESGKTWVLMPHCDFAQGTAVLKRPCCSFGRTITSLGGILLRFSSSFKWTWDCFH